MNTLESLILTNKDWSYFSHTCGQLVVHMRDSVSTHKLTNELINAGFDSYNNANRVFVKLGQPDEAKEMYLKIYKLNHNDCYNRC